MEVFSGVISTGLLFSLFSCGSSLVPFSPRVSEWTFKEGPKGPSTWAARFPGCSDSNLWQTPINIPFETTPACFDPLTFCNLNYPQINVTLQNAWRSGILFPDPSFEISVCGGPLPRNVKYYLHGIAFSVGSTNSNGSNHLIRGVAHAGEVVLIFNDVPEANLTSDSLANTRLTISFLIDISPYDNLGWDSVIRSFPRIKRAGSHTKLDIASVLALLPQYQDWTTRYYTYVGSSPAPPCREHLLKVIYTTPINLSSNQVNALRQICDEDGDRIVNNVRRPLRPLNSNQVLRSFIH